MKSIPGAFAVALLIVLAGCAKNTSKPTDGTETSDTSTTSTTTTTPSSTSTGNPPPGGISHATAVSMVDCIAYGHTMTVDNAKVQGLLPTGFTAASDLPAGMAGWTVWTCAQLVLDNETVVPGFAMSLVAVNVLPPSGTAGPSGTDVYALELLVSSDVAAARFASLGFEAGLADIVIAPTPVGQTITVSINGQAVYVDEGAGDQPTSPDGTVFVTRTHQAEGAHVWMDFEETQVEGAVTQSSFVTASGHALGETSAVPGQPVAALGGWTSVDEEIEFGRP